MILAQYETSLDVRGGERARSDLLTRHHFERVRQLIKNHAGIHLSDGKEPLVQSRLGPLLRQQGLASYDDLFDLLKILDSSLWQPFVNALTTNLTSFFREPHHFEILGSYLKAYGGSPRIWCSASSTGEEPWSIAMTVLEARGIATDVSVFASDIDTEVLRTAEAGVYSIGADCYLDEARMRRWFMRGSGRNSGRIRIGERLARCVRFGPVNLVRGSLPFNASFDVVFCRNVMIYFDAATQRSVLERIHAVMNTGGLLFVGHSKNFTDHNDLFRLTGQTVYERVG